MTNAEQIAQLKQWSLDECPIKVSRKAFQTIVNMLEQQQAQIEQLTKPQNLQEFVVVEQLLEVNPVEVYRAVQKAVQKVHNDNKELKAQIDELTKQRDRFKSAIDNECILWHFTVDEENPRKSIQQLLDITATVARDPNVCSEASQFALANNIQGIEDALKSVPPTRHGNWKLIDIRDYLGRLKDQLKNGGEL